MMPLRFLSYCVGLLLTGIIFLMGSCGSPTGKAPAKTVSQTQKRTANDSTKSKSNGSSQKKVLFFGNSLTAGFGLKLTEAFPHLIQLKIDSLGWGYQVMNGGLSGETTASGKTRIDWFLEEKIEIFVLELGGNDGLRGIAIEETKANLQAIIDKAKAKYPQIKIVLAGMQVPPNMGQTYGQAFSQMYPELAKANQAVLIPFLLEKVGGEPSLNLPDGIHPTVQGHQIVAQTVWKFLKPVLEELNRAS